MNLKKILFYIIPIIIGTIIILIIQNSSKQKEMPKVSTAKMKATILCVDDEKTTILDENHLIYNLKTFSDEIKSGDVLVIEYTGLIDNMNDIQSIEILNFERQNLEADENGIPLSWKDNGIFSTFYVMAFNKMKELSLDEKIGQLLLVRYDDTKINDALDKYHVSGFIFYEKDFAGKNESDVKNNINNLQKKSKIPLLTAVDEEGGNVVRISSNNKLVGEKFKSPQELYNDGGMEKIKNDTINKSNILNNLGINLNLAPVVDVSTDPNDYIYNRTIGENTEITSLYAKTVIEASKGHSVSYTLKHFPGYGNNGNTHNSVVTDNRDYQDILNNDIPPFKAGIDVGAEAILFSHNIITSIDPNDPASLSPIVHNILRNDLNFTGISITDDLDMQALDNIDDKTLEALVAGNDLIITTNYEQSFNEIKNAIENDYLDESILDEHVFKILAWKYYKGLMFNAK